MMDRVSRRGKHSVTPYEDYYGHPRPKKPKNQAEDQS